MQLRVQENFALHGEFYAKILLIILIIGCLHDLPLLLLVAGSGVAWYLIMHMQGVIDRIPIDITRD
jgi:hypothetical protein